MQTPQPKLLKSDPWDPSKKKPAVLSFPSYLISFRGHQFALRVFQQTKATALKTVHSPSLACDILSSYFCCIFFQSWPFKTLNWVAKNLFFSLLFLKLGPLQGFLVGKQIGFDCWNRSDACCCWWLSFNPSEKYANVKLDRLLP